MCSCVLTVSAGRSGGSTRPQSGQPAGRCSMTRSGSWARVRLWPSCPGLAPPGRACSRRSLRSEIARSREPTGILAQRYGVSTETIRKWRKRGPADCQDHSSRPHKLPWKATEEERAIVCALRRATGFPLDDLTFVVTHFLPHLNRDAVYRILKAEGLGRLAPAS